MSLPPILAKRAAGNAILLDLSVPAELDVFRGHFPEMPVLPGVVQIDWALRLARAQGLIRGEAEMRDFQVKFRNIIRPQMPLTLTLRFDDIKRRVHFDYHCAGALMSSGHLNLRADVP
jgi:3-hydroxymyristoyl/3-hydroxydecanoyl-(acyl carrier protein) dehydratase